MNTNSSKVYKTGVTEELLAKRDATISGLKEKTVFNGNIQAALKEGDVLEFPDSMDELLIDDRTFAGNKYYVVGCVKNATELYWLPVSALVRQDADNKPIGEVAQHLLEVEKVNNAWDAVEKFMNGKNRTIVAGKQENREFPVFEGGKLQDKRQKRLIAPLNYAKA